MSTNAYQPRPRRSDIEFAASLTMCDGTWLEQPPTAEELQRIESAQRAITRSAGVRRMFGDNWEELNRFSLELFNRPEFAALVFDDWLIARVIEAFGEPPVAEELDDPRFTEYLVDGVTLVCESRVRFALASQLRRLIPQFVDAAQLKEATAIDYNVYRTNSSDEITPFLVQMLVLGLLRWYADEEDETPELA